MVNIICCMYFFFSSFCASSKYVIVIVNPSVVLLSKNLMKSVWNIQNRLHTFFIIFGGLLIQSEETSSSFSCKTKKTYFLLRKIKSRFRDLSERKKSRQKFSFFFYLKKKYIFTFCCYFCFIFIIEIDYNFCSIINVVWFQRKIEIEFSST